MRCTGGSWGAPSTPIALLPCGTLLVCTEQAAEVVELLMGSFAHFVSPGCIGRLHPFFLKKAMIFKKMVFGQVFWKILPSIHWWERWSLRAVPLVSHGQCDGNSGARATAPWEQEFELHSWRVGSTLMLGASVVLGINLDLVPVGHQPSRNHPGLPCGVGSFHGLPEGLSSATLSQTHHCLPEPHCVFRLLQAQLNGENFTAPLCCPFLLIWQKEVMARCRLSVVAAGMCASFMGNPW